MAFKCFLTAAGLVVMHLVSAQTAVLQPDSLQPQTYPLSIVDFEESVNSFILIPSLPPVIPLPAYTQGAFCDFEDAINRNRRLRIDFGVK